MFRVTYGKILLVGKDQEDGIPELILVEHALKLLTSLNDTVTIVGVDNEDDTLGVLEVVPPQRTDLVLTTDIPHGELDVLVLYRLDVEAWSLAQVVSKLALGMYRYSEMYCIPMVGMVVTISPSLSL